MEKSSYISPVRDYTFFLENGYWPWLGPDAVNSKPPLGLDQHWWIVSIPNGNGEGWSPQHRFETRSAAIEYAERIDGAKVWQQVKCGRCKRVKKGGKRGCFCDD